MRLNPVVEHVFVGGSKLGCLVQRLDCQFGMSCIQLHNPKPGQGLNVLRLCLNRLSQIAQSLVILIALILSYAEKKMSAGRSRIEFERLLDRGDGLQNFSLFQLNKAKVKVCGSERG